MATGIAAPSLLTALSSVQISRHASLDTHYQCYQRKPVLYKPLTLTSRASDRRTRDSQNASTIRTPLVVLPESTARRSRWAVVAAAAAGAAAASSAADIAEGGRQGSFDVVVTREAGKNGQLVSVLESRGLRCFEMPLIEHSPGPDRDSLPTELKNNSFEWIVVTSPEAAKVFMQGWIEAGKPAVKVAVVGDATGRVLSRSGHGMLHPVFTPSIALGEVLARELPLEGNGQVLYPASAKAGSDVEGGLRERGFEVKRLSTYDTTSVSAISDEAKAIASAAKVACFGSPTAVKAWVKHVGAIDGIAAACIGSTSAKAAQKAGLQKIFYPEKPGVDGWAESVEAAMSAVSDRPRPAPSGNVLSIL